MPPTLDTDQRDLPGIEGLQLLAVLQRDQPVACAMQYIGVAIHLPDPFVGLQLVAQQVTHGQYREKPLHRAAKAEVRRVKDEVARRIFTCQLGRKTAAQAPSIYDYMIFIVLGLQRIINELHIIQHLLLAPLTRAFTKAPVIHQHHIIMIAVKIPGILGPSFNATCITMKIKYQAMRVLHMKVQAIDTHTFLHIKKQLPEWHIIFIQKILPKLFRLEDEFLLHQVNNDDKHCIAGDDIYNKCWRQSALRAQFIGYWPCLSQFDKSHSSSGKIRLSLSLLTGATMSGNFSTVTLLCSSPKPRSSLRLLSLIQK